jgi:hypothetical protein
VGDAVGSVLFDPLGVAVDGSAGIRPAVPLVRLAEKDPRFVSCGAHRRLTGEIALGALQAGRDLEYSGSSIGIGR